MLVAAGIEPLLPGPVWPWAMVAVIGMAAFKWLPRLIPLFCACLLICMFRGLVLPRDARNLLPDRPQTVNVRMSIQGDPRTVHLPGGRTEIRQPARFTARFHNGDWNRMHGRVQLRWSEVDHPGLLPGSVYEGRGVLSPQELPHVGLRKANWKLDIVSPHALQKIKK